MSFNRRFFAIHSYLGLLAGIFMISISLTGAFIALVKEYERNIHSDLLLVKPIGEKLSYDKLFALAKKDVANFYLYDYARFPQKPNEALEILYFPDGSYHSVFINPYSGRIQGYLNGENNLSRILIKFHWSFFIGKQGYLGAFLAFIVALLVISSIITGFVIYRKHILKVLTFREKISFQNWRRTSSGLHRVIGVWSWVFMLTLFGTGAYINYHIINGNYAYPGGETLKQSPKQVLNISVDKILEEVKKAIPDFQPRGFSFPQLLGGDYSINGDFATDNPFISPSSFAEFDTRGNFIAFTKGDNKSAFSKFENVLFTLHYASYGGLFIKILYCLFGVLSGSLPITGFLLWWRRNRKSSKKLF